MIILISKANGVHPADNCYTLGNLIWIQIFFYLGAFVFVCIFFTFFYVNEKLRNFKILFIDDRSINLETPKELGWDTYCANSGGDLNGIKNACNEFLKGSE